VADQVLARHARRVPAPRGTARAAPRAPSIPPARRRARSHRRADRQRPARRRRLAPPPGTAAAGAAPCAPGCARSRAATPAASSDPAASPGCATPRGRSPAQCPR
jgi:hypothetical protein